MVVTVDNIQLLVASRLIDEEWYRSRNRMAGGESTLAHFVVHGWPRRAAPSAFFDPGFYLATQPEVAAAGLDPLSHYLELGEAEGRWPCRLFDPLWYAQAHGVPAGKGAALAHYLGEGVARGLKPNAFFDPRYYLDSNPDVGAELRAGTMHYLFTGHRENRLASPDFDGIWYRRNYSLPVDEDPIHHYLTVGQAMGRPRNAQGIDSAAREVRLFTAPGPLFEALDPSLAKSGAARAKVIAFYLPQFHSIPENDEWWGAGFTEWRNVARGQPRFVGHHQPRVPRDLGFYDLADPATMRRQIDLAKAAGLHGFCFYYYQFGKRRLLEKPLEQMLADPSLDMPFCLMWANENWTRRWDGQESEVLLGQDYAEENDEAFIESIATAMADPRYIRIDGRPLFFVYRPGIIPDMVARVARWRGLFQERYGIEPWLLMAQTFHDHDPTPYGLDGAVEFPPHKLTTGSPRATDRVKLVDPEFGGIVYDYDDIVATSLSEAEPSFPLIRTLFPSWDNDARRQGNGTSVMNSSPAAYQRWLEALIERARVRRFAGEPLVFVNAWNEWAEGAYLEPDVHFGSAYINATARAVVGTTVHAAAGKPHILLVGHDAHEHGAQMLLLHLGRTFARSFGVKVTFLLLGHGKLVAEYREIGDVIVTRADAGDLDAAIDELKGRGIALALTNTVVTGSLVPRLKRVGLRVVSLVHELPRIIRSYSIEGAAQSIARDSDVVVFAADLVKTGFEGSFAQVAGHAEIMPQGLYADIVPAPDARRAVRAELGLPDSARIVLGIGYADLRKGADLFFETARRAAASDPDLCFVWVGALEAAVATWILGRDDAGSLPDNVRHVAFTSTVDRYLQAADAFYMTSREEYEKRLLSMTPWSLFYPEMSEAVSSLQAA